MKVEVIVRIDDREVVVLSEDIFGESIDIEQQTKALKDRLRGGLPQAFDLETPRSVGKRPNQRMQQRVWGELRGALCSVFNLRIVSISFAVFRQAADCLKRYSAR